MNPIRLLTVQAQLDESWEWSAYDEQGRKVLYQDKCTDMAHALECAVASLLSGSSSEAATAPALPSAQAKKPRPRRRARTPG